jgi:hypothetical protein
MGKHTDRQKTQELQLEVCGMTDLYSETFKAYGLPEPIKEYRFDKVRKWRIDYAWPFAPDGRPIRLGVELEGGAYSSGRHTRGAGFVADLEKYNAMIEQGWRLLRYVPNVKKINYNQVFAVYRKLFNKEAV